MKKISLLLLSIVLCSFTTPEEITTISGKIMNAENNTIRIKGELLDKEIKLKANGSFSENLVLELDRIYKIETTRNSFPIYVSKDYRLVINADDANLPPTLKFTGKGSVENNYLYQKQLVTSATPDQELYEPGENEFLKKLHEIKISVLNLYKKTKFTDANFKEKEARSIYFLEQKHLFYYKKDHNYYGQVDNFIVSETYPKLDATMDLDNDSDFLFSNEYCDIVLRNFYASVKIDDDQPFDVSAKCNSTN